MIRSSVRSAGIALLLTMNGCGAVISSGTGARTPGLNVAEAALDGGAGQIALQVSDGVLRGSPDNVHALEIKGDALTLLGDYDQAGAIFQALLAKDPNSVRAGIGLGRVTLAKSPAEAEQLFQQVLQHDPRNVTALNNLGIARDLQGHHAQAQPAYHQALAINPDLESAQVNLALSMAMNGQGTAAVKMLQAKATQPGAPIKVRHDYAVVLAMAGNRAGAERVLSDDMPPDQVRQLLDSATGTHTAASAGNDAFASSQREDDIPPDVVQVPEAAPVPGKPQHAVAAALAAPPPMVVRPRASVEPDADTPMMQPVNPVAAAVTNQQPLALPIHATASNPAPVQRVTATVSDAAAVTPEVVAMPPADAGQRPVADRAPAASAAHAMLPDVPPAQPALRPAPLPPSFHPLTTAHAEVPVLPTSIRGIAQPRNATATPVRSDAGRINPARAAAPVGTSQAGRNFVQSAPAAPPTVMASAAIAPALALPRTAANVGPYVAVAKANAATETARARTGGSDEASTMVQFAAATSQEAAHSFWKVLVHRFPDALGQREPVVIRFERDGTVFWRVRAEGFGSLSEAQTLCARMRAGGQACFVPRS
jgi:Flp pilus assembly protein TadD